MPGFLKLENGPPSHDTFSQLFRWRDKDQARAAFQRFMAGFSKQVQGVIAIDGKVVRRSFYRASGKSPLHMVSAWGCGQRLVLAQIATDAKSISTDIAFLIDTHRWPDLAAIGKDG